MCHIIGKVSGILLVSVPLYIFDLSEILRFQFNSHCSIDIVLLTCDCEILYGLLCLVCEIDCKILYGLLGLLCEKCDSFSLFLFEKVFINWGTCVARTSLSRQLPIFLVNMPMRILVNLFSDSICLWNIFLLFWCICLLIALSMKYFFSYYGASVFRLQLFIDFI